jgi:diacylglycerol kinase family enzyme
MINPDLFAGQEFALSVGGTVVCGAARDKVIKLVRKDGRSYRAVWSGDYEAATKLAIEISHETPDLAVALRSVAVCVYMS